MISKNQVKYLHSLRQSKFRKIEKAFIAEGVKLLEELIASDFKIKQVYGISDWISLHQDILHEKKIGIVEVSEDELEKISSLVTPNEVLTVVAMREEEIPEPEQAGSLALVLDRLQDPGNMGTIIRTADWFGIRHIYCSQDTVEVYNPKVVQSTMGSICRVAVHYVELSSFLAKIKGRRTIYGTFINGKSVYDLEPNLPAAVIIGNESQGISGDLLNQIDEKITIPRVNTGAESLNASVAAGIICAEFARKSVVVGH